MDVHVHFFLDAGRPLKPCEPQLLQLTIGVFWSIMMLNDSSLAFTRARLEMKGVQSCSNA